MTGTATPRDWLYMSALVVFWGSAFVGISIALRSFAPVTMVLLRLLTGSLTMLLVLLLVPRFRQKLTLQLSAWFAVMALLGNVLPFTLIGWAQQFVPSGVAGLLMAFVPLATLLLAHLLLPDEPITRNKLIGFVLGFLGILVLMWPDLSQTAGNSRLLGMLAVLAAAVSYAFANIVARKRPPSGDTFTTAATLCFASLLMLPLCVAFDPPPWTRSVASSSVLAVLLLGILSTALATYLYFRVLRSAGAAFVSQINYLIPVWAVFLGVWALDEDLTLNSVLALMLVISGILVAQVKTRVPQ